MDWFASIQDPATSVSQLAGAGAGQGAAVLLVLVLVVLTAIHRVSDAAPPSRLSSLGQGVEIVVPPLIVGFVIVIALSIANAVR